jgi:tetratricopeptide (TPR) repeat protein
VTDLPSAQWQLSRRGVHCLVLAALCGLMCGLMVCRLGLAESPLERLLQELESKDSVNSLTNAGAPTAEIDNTVRQIVSGRNDLVSREGGLFEAIAATHKAEKLNFNALRELQVADANRGYAAALVTQEEKTVARLKEETMAYQAARRTLAVADRALRDKQDNLRLSQRNLDDLCARLRRDLPPFFKGYATLHAMLPHERSPVNSQIAAALRAQEPVSSVFIDGHIVLAGALAYEGQNEQAADYLEKAGEILKEYPSPFISRLAEDLCSAWLLLGKHEKVGPFVSVLKKMNPKHRSARQEWLLGAHAAQRGRHGEASPRLLSAIGKVGRDSPAALIAEAAFSQLMDNVRVEELPNIAKLLERTAWDSSWPVLRSRATLAAAEKRWDEATRLLEECRKKAPPRLDAELNDQSKSYQNEKNWRRKG